MLVLVLVALVVHLVHLVLGHVVHLVHLVLGLATDSRCVEKLVEMV